MLAKTTSKDLGTAVAISLAGIALVLLGMRAHWNPQDLNPGVEGCLTATVVGFGMALLHPVPYARALAICALPTAAQYFICAYAAVAATGLGITGIQLVLMGFVGIAFALREPREAAAPSRASIIAARRPAHSHG
jgi:hypothetical protein